MMEQRPEQARESELEKGGRLVPETDKQCGPEMNSQQWRDMDSEQGTKMDNEQGLEWDNQQVLQMDRQLGPEMHKQKGLHMVDQQSPAMAHQQGAKMHQQQGPVMTNQKDSAMAHQAGPAMDHQQGPAIGDQQGLAMNLQRDLEMNHQQGLAMNNQQGLAINNQQGLAMYHQQGLAMNLQQDLEMNHQQDLAMNNQQDLAMNNQQGLAMNNQQGLATNHQQGLAMNLYQDLAMNHQQGLAMNNQQGGATDLPQGQAMDHQKGLVMDYQEVQAMDYQQGAAIDHQEHQAMDHLPGPATDHQQGPQMVPQHGPAMPKQQWPQMDYQEGPEVDKQHRLEVDSQEQPAMDRQHGSEVERKEGPETSKGMEPEMREQMPMEKVQASVPAWKIQQPMEHWEMLGNQFMEYQESCPFLIVEEQQRRLWALNSLFLKAYDHTDGIVAMPNMHIFAKELSFLLAVELRKKISNKPAEKARLAIEQFLQEDEQLENQGHLLLRSIYLLSHTDQDCLRHIIHSSLPDACMQCLYLFFAFPLDTGQKGPVHGVNQNDSFKEMFTQTVVNMLSHPEGVEELLKTSELQSLIKATISLWEQSSLCWHSPTIHVLRAVSRAQTSSIIHYLHASCCLKMAFQSLSAQVDTLPSADLCEMTSLLVSFLNDSSPLSMALLQQFEDSEGYPMLVKILLRCGQDSVSAAEQHLDDLLLALAHLTTCGKTELKVSGNITPPQLPDLQIQVSSDSANCVRNLQAFQVLQTVFQKSEDSWVCAKILATIRTIWLLNKANFFLLEWTLQPMSQFVDLIHLRHASIQGLFFQLVEFIIVELTYIPHEILRKVQGLIKETESPLCTIAALECLLRISQRDQLFSDIFRDSGLLGSLLAQLRKQAKLLRKTVGRGDLEPEPEGERALTAVRLRVVAALVRGSVRNAVVMKDYGMVPYIKIFLDEACYRAPALQILEHLSVINAEEYMRIIIGVLCSSTQGECQLRLDALKSLLQVLQTSKGRSAFRTASGFNGLLSVLDEMEGALSDPPSAAWTTIQPLHVLELIQATLSGISAALHQDPVNCDFFRSQQLFEKLAEDLQLLGCFCVPEQGRTILDLTEKRTFQQFVHLALHTAASFPSTLRSCITLSSFLDLVAMGSLHLEKPQIGIPLPCAAAPDNSCTDAQEEQSQPCTEAKNTHNETRRLSHSRSAHFVDPEIVHPGAVCALVRLLPNIHSNEHPQLSKEIQCALAEHIQSLVTSERNRQVMCEGGLLRTLVTFCHEALTDGCDTLHLPLVRVFEKLASQAVEPDILRQFLRFALAPDVSKQEPVSSSSGKICSTTEGISENHESVELEIPKPLEGHQEKEAASQPRLPARTPQVDVSLISMTSPRNFQSHTVTLAPSFVEFDMSSSGYGCLFLPTVGAVMGANAEHSISGGSGTGTRSFPPTAGVSFSSWFLVSRFGEASDAHPIRFLTVVRHMSRAEQQFVCLSISISPIDRTLVISTEEEPFQALDTTDMETLIVSPPPLPSRAHFNVSKVLALGQWQHLAVVLSRDMKRTCTVSAFIDGELVGSEKQTLYIQPLPGPSTGLESTSVLDVYAYIATPPVWKQSSSLLWRLGPTYLFDEPLSVDVVKAMYMLGPNYYGNFQGVQNGLDFVGSRAPAPLIAEEKISWGINARSTSWTSIEKIKEHFNDVDGRMIAREMGIDSRDNLMPVLFAKNVAAHLLGPARTIGASGVGQTGLRVFHASPAAKALNFLGGPAVLLGLIAMANDDSGLYAAVKVFLSVLSSSAMSRQLMDHMSGYQILVFLLKKKSRLLNRRILQLLFSITGTANLNFGPSAIESPRAFQMILCDFELWLNAPDNLDLAVFSHMLEVLRSSRADGCGIVKEVHQMELVPKLTFLLNDPNITRSKITIICTILTHLLQGCLNTKDILRVGLFLVYTLHPSSVDEKHICLEGFSDMETEVCRRASVRTIWLRQQLLMVMLQIVCADNTHLPSEKQEEIYQLLGPDWFLLFIQSHLHPTSVSLGMRLLVHFLHYSTLLGNFKDVVKAGSWLRNSTAGMEMLMDNVKSSPLVPLQMPEPCLHLLSGFSMLQVCLKHHIQNLQIYRLLAGLLLQNPQCGQAEEEVQCTLDLALQSVFDTHTREKVQQAGLCTEAALLLLEMVNATIGKSLTGMQDSWEVTYPGSVMQFICRVYYSYPSDALWVSADFLQTLAIVVFPSGAQLDICGAAFAAEKQGAGFISQEDPKGTEAAHPARKQVCDFTRILLMDTLLNTPARKQSHPLDLLLEASVENCSIEQRRIFQTEVLLSTISILQVIGQNGGQTISARGGGTEAAALDGTENVVSSIVANVSYFSQKLVDKLYARMFISDPQHILLFLTEQITMVVDVPVAQREHLYSNLYSSLNRTLLYCLSGAHQTITDLLKLLHVLKMLIERWDIIFATYNSNMSFITCFIHCLFQIRAGSYPEGFGIDAASHPSSWHLIFQREETAGGELEELSEFDVQAEVVKMVETVWEMLISQRRHALEDTYKMDLSVKPGHLESRLKMSEVTPLWEEAAANAWRHYLASEKKTLTNKWVPQRGKTAPRLVSAMKMMKVRNINATEGSVQDFSSCLDKCWRSAQDIFTCLYEDHLQKLHCTARNAARDWATMKGQLMSERGLWGPSGGQTHQRMELSAHEGPTRMRRRINRCPLPVKAPHLKQQPYQLNEDSVSQDYKEKEVNSPRHVLDEDIDENAGGDEGQLTFFPALHESLRSEEIFHQCIERETLLQELVDKEKISAKFSVALVDGLTVTEGVLLFGKEHFYICENFTLSLSGDIYCTKHCISSLQDSFIFTLYHKKQPTEIEGRPSRSQTWPTGSEAGPTGKMFPLPGSVSGSNGSDIRPPGSRTWSTRSQTSVPGNPVCQRFSSQDVKEIQPMRFLLQEIALEIYFKSGYSTFVVFPNKDQGLASKRFGSLQVSLKAKGVPDDSINFSLKITGGEKTMLQKWQKGELSNFEYLMCLNTQAGRTHCDYMQYPVFPWIIADYESETLDLLDPRTFRDLSKPMGGQNPERMKKFIQRFNEVEKSEGELSAQCHYCTHYSSASIVASYLVRLEPFTSTLRSLQGGYFDVADRMFHSVRSAWISASRENMSDVRELTPEFFFLPEFLTNSNRCQFGSMQDGTFPDDVLLPPWAQGDPDAFIRLHRQALESDHVSANLHHWIDLIFGYKQAGQAAVDAVNAFHPYFYGDSMDHSKGPAPHIQSIIMGFVSNFGQMPRQLFHKPHPPRTGQGKISSRRDLIPSVISTGSMQKPFFFQPQSLKPTAVPLKDHLRGQVGQIIHTEKTLFVVEKNKVLIPPLWSKSVSWGYDDFSCSLGSYGSEKVIAVCETMADWGQCLCAVCPSANTVITAGTSSVVCVWELSLVKGKLRDLSLKQPLYGHTKAVTCLAASSAYGVIVSGSSDRSCIIWDLHLLTYLCQLPEHQAELSALAISDSSGNILSCAETSLYLWTINGRPLASISFTGGPERSINCCCFSELHQWDSRSILVTGCADGFIRLWRLKSSRCPEEPAPETAATQNSGATVVEVAAPRGLELCAELSVGRAKDGKPNRRRPAVTALAISSNHTKLLAGDKSGKVYCWSTDGSDMAKR